MPHPVGGAMGVTCVCREKGPGYTCFDIILFGASLSEPHISVTALHTCVCMLACSRPYTVNFK